jgi:hypothetical protein
VHGSPTTQSPLATRDNAASGIAFRAYDRVGTLDIGVLRKAAAFFAREEIR